MQKSESIKNIAAALITFHVKCDVIKKDATNPFFKSKYASLSNILEQIEMPLNESGLSFCQFPSGEHGLHTILMHSSGEFISDEYTMRPTKDDPQGLGSAITYQRRYALASILGLNIDDDDDGNEASKQVERKNVGKPIFADGTPVKDDKPWLNKSDPAYYKIINRLINKTTTIDTIKQHYKINKQVYAELEAAIKNEVIGHNELPY